MITCMQLNECRFCSSCKATFFHLTAWRAQKRTKHRVNLFFMRMMHNTLLHEISHSFAASRAISMFSLEFLRSFEMVLHHCDSHKVCVFYSYFSLVRHHFWHKHHQVDRHFFLLLHPCVIYPCHLVDSTVLIVAWKLYFTWTRSRITQFPKKNRPKNWLFCLHNWLSLQFHWNQINPKWSILIRFLLTELNRSLLTNIQFEFHTHSITYTRFATT